jgi:hypothetical protein
MSMPKIPKQANPAPPVRMDDPEVLAEREERVRQNRASGLMNTTVLTPLGSAAPRTQLKTLLGE